MWRGRSLLLGLAFLPSVEVCYLCVTCYALMLFINGGWYSSCNGTQLLFTRHHDYTCLMNVIGDWFSCLIGQQNSTTCVD